MKATARVVLAACIGVVTGCNGTLVIHHQPLVGPPPMMSVVVSCTHWGPATVGYWHHCGLAWGEVVLLHDISFYAHVSPRVVWESYHSTGASWHQVVSYYHVEHQVVSRYFESATVSFDEMTDEHLVQEATVEAIAAANDVPEAEVKSLVEQGYSYEQMESAFEHTTEDRDESAVLAELQAEREQPAEETTSVEDPAWEEPTTEVEEVPSTESDDEEKKHDGDEG